jgi:hypothetical protein
MHTQEKSVSALIAAAIAALLVVSIATFLPATAPVLAQDSK